METRKWKRSPSTYLVTRAKTPPCSSPGNQLPNNVPEKYGGITQLNASRHEQKSDFGQLGPQNPPTPPTSLISHDDDNKVFTS